MAADPLRTRCDVEPSLEFVVPIGGSCDLEVQPVVFFVPFDVDDGCVMRKVQRVISKLLPKFPIVFLRVASKL